MAHQETLVEWARRQRATSVTVTPPRVQLNRKSLSEHTAAVARELALKNLYVELEAMIGDIRPSPLASAKPPSQTLSHADRRSSAPLPSRPMPANAARTDLMPPVVGGTVFMNQRNRPAPRTETPTAPVERRRPRPF